MMPPSQRNTPSHGTSFRTLPLARGLPLTRGRAHRSPLLLLVSILLIAAAFRIAALTELPPGLQHDEVFHAHDAFTVRQGYTPLWFSSNAGNEPLYIYLMAISTALIGDNVLGIRLTAVLCGLLAVALTTRWAHLSFGRRAALIAAGLMAVSFWPVWMSRVGLRAASLPPMVALTAWLWVRAASPPHPPAPSPGEPRRSGSARVGRGGAVGMTRIVSSQEFITTSQMGRGFVRFALAGVALGLTLYTYPAVFSVPLAFGAYYVYLALFRRDVLRRSPWGHAAFWLAASLAYVPLGLAIAGAGGYLRVQQTAAPLDALRSGDPGPLLDAAGKTLLMWTTRGDPLWRYNMANRPVFDPLSAALFVIGAGGCVWLAFRKGRGHGHGMLVPLFLLIGVLPSAVTDSPPAFLRASAALPATYLALAVGVEMMGEFIGARIGRAQHAVPLRMALAMAVVVVGGGLTIRDYFGTWRYNEEVQRVYRTDLAEIGAYLRTHAAPGGIAISTTEPNHLDRFIFDYTPHGAGEIHWFDGLNAIVAPAGDAPAWLFVSREPIPGERLQRDFLDQLPLIREQTLANGSLAYRLYEIPPGEAFFEAFPPPTDQSVWVADVLAFPPDNPDGVRARLDYPVQFGDMLQLAGYSSPARNPANNWLPMALYFRVLRDVVEPEPWSLFAHVLDANGALVAGRDFLAVPASTWRAGDAFVQMHDVALPDLPPGLYHVEIGLYSQADNVRFPILVDGTRVGDRLLLEPVEVYVP